MTTHARITAHVVSELRAVRPEENYTYLYLGNFLTDLSQLRDPYACVHAKAAVLTASGVPILGLPVTRVAAAQWMKDLFGQAKPADKRYGALTQFLEMLARALTHLVFADDSPVHSGALAGAGQILGVPLPAPLPPAEVDRVLGEAFTQYYPHEHLDFPPYYDPGTEDVRNTSSASRTQGRLIAYLQEQVQYIVEELTKLELAWLTASQPGGSDQGRHDVLRRLGHILHAAEDYYFHSNFAENYQWQRLLRDNPKRQAGNSADRSWLLLHDLDGTVDQTSDIRPRRRFARRTRYPVFSHLGMPVGTARYWADPSGSTSKDASQLVYTGGFGGKDIFHSIRNGLAFVERVLGTDSDLTLVRVAASREERRRAARDGGYRKQLIRTHAAQLAGGTYRKRIDKALGDGKLSPASADALRSAFSIDAALQQKHPVLGGVGGFLITLLAMQQDEIDKSDQQATKLDADADAIADDDTDNGTSAETIGSHSLLAKDDEEELPLRQAALSLAEYASASLAVLLAQRVTRDPGLSRGLDWDSIVRLFLRFPLVQPQSWESAVITAVNQRQQLNTDKISDRPNFQLLGPDFHADKLQSLRNGTKTSELEQYYRKLESVEDF